MQSSQRGQSEYIFSWLESYGIKDGTCFEAGAGSPDWISNSKVFIENGWKAYLVERDQLSCEKWKSLALDNVSIFNTSIPYRQDGLITIFKENKIPQDIDVLFLDIDGGEYQLLEGFISGGYRPKVICVEYAYAFPISIDYIPTSICYQKQASSIAFFRMLSSAGYVYLKTFFQDHIFVDRDFAAKINAILPPPEYFYVEAAANIAQFDRVLLCQYSGDQGVKFYESSLRILMSQRHACTASFYSYIVGGINCCLGVLNQLEDANPDYYKEFKRAGIKFMKDYSHLLM